MINQKVCDLHEEGKISAVTEAASSNEQLLQHCSNTLHIAETYQCHHPKNLNYSTDTI